MRRRGFTLIEVVMAMALVGLVLVGLNTFIFSMSELWGKNADVRLFDQHVRAVTRFLQREMVRATLPPAASANSTPVGVQPITPSGPPGTTWSPTWSSPATGSCPGPRARSPRSSARCR